ncbi:hypothetical protein CXB51_000303 [Gossypium anomalum]|uniref:DUF4283 domain-containing protein n=1 Tax=Gossypium anomalum TaxID=47600 RepID=A0A8J5ZK52_9ROSI|nr:hypothetical protein CXB51_000303 [Gossypium anomalum]
MDELEISLEGRDGGCSNLTRFMVVGKIHAKKILNRKGIFNILKGIWSGDDILCIREVEGNIYAISLARERSYRKALAEGPWSVIGCSIQFLRWDKVDSISKMDFSSIQYWIQVHNLPMEWLSKKNVEIIGSRLGKVVEIDDDLVRNGICRSFLRLRVELDLGRHLVEGF